MEIQIECKNINQDVIDALQERFGDEAEITYTATTQEITVVLTVTDTKGFLEEIANEAIHSVV